MVLTEMDVARVGAPYLGQMVGLANLVLAKPKSEGQFKFPNNNKLPLFVVGSPSSDISKLKLETY